MTKTQFLIDLNSDFKAIVDFSDQDFEMRGGFNNYQDMIKDYPELKNCSQIKNLEERKEIFHSFLEKEYKKEKNLMMKRRGEIELLFDGFKDEFFVISSELFDNHPWPEGEYKIFLSLWKIYLRNIKEKTITIPFKRDNENTLRLVCHELLHILFYDYWKENFKDKMSVELTWDFSEIINVILLNLSEINKFFNVKENAFPNHKERYEYLNKIYSKCNSMKEFFDKSIDYLKKHGDNYGDLAWDDLAEE